jgi:acyl-CoA thioester hydrolase
MTATAIPAPFEDRLVVRPEWLDPNGHMNVAFYMRAVDDGSNAFFDDIGLGWDYTERGEGSIFVTGCNIDFRRELFAGNRLRVTTRLVDWSPKLLHCYSEVINDDEDYVAATCETLYMHILFATRRSAPMPAAAQQRLIAIAAAHSALPTPLNLNRPLGIRR